MEHEAFVERVMKHLPSASPGKFEFAHWSHAGRPTDEGFGVLPIAGADPEKIAAAVLDVDHYVGNIDYVSVCRSVKDPRFAPPEHVRFYQKLDIPLLGAIQHELVLHDLGTRNGWRVVAWDVLRAETDALSAKEAFRSDYNHGAWFVKPGIVGYALGSAPKRDDVGFLKWKALTSGADAAASRVVKGNIEGLAKWAAKRA